MINLRKLFNKPSKDTVVVGKLVVVDKIDNVLLSSFMGIDMPSLSWEYLMPVIEKINSLGYWFIMSKNSVRIKNYNLEQLVFIMVDKTGDPIIAKSHIVQIIRGVESGIPLEMAYVAVIEFIKYYNEVKK